MPFFLLLGFPSEGISETYKYQDERGQWHYSDKPPQTSSKSQETLFDNTKKTAPPRDLVGMLEKKFVSNNPEEIATLAVVEIKNALGHGSGFFITNDGYIVTNRHVVKPTESVQWDKYEKALAEQEKLFIAAGRELDSRKAYHKKIYHSLVEHEKNIKRYMDQASRKILGSRYKIIYNNYKESERLLKITKSNYNAAKRNFKKSKSYMSNKGRESYWAQKYKIRIKDGTILNARYVGASKDHDLAFLKLDRFKTPFLVPAGRNIKLRGSKVFAIGSPLGISDSLTSGTVTSIQGAYIYTDTSIFPGNSGGPLIDETGKVLGVIAQKITKNNVMSKGFGIAIPINIVNIEFKKLRAK